MHAFMRNEDPTWVRRVEAARSEIEAVEGLLIQRKLDQAVEEATTYVDGLIREHSYDEHANGVNVDCPLCFPLQLDPDELLREHRGW